MVKGSSVTNSGPPPKRAKRVCKIGHKAGVNLEREIRKPRSLKTLNGDQMMWIDLSDGRGRVFSSKLICK